MVMKVISASSGEKHEECGVVAIYSKNGAAVAPLLYRSLIALQHRGQDAAGFAVQNNGEIGARRGIGLVDQIFRPEDIEVNGDSGIGHTRYPTIGKCRMCDVQPSVHDNIATAYNGHIANYDILKERLGKAGYVFTSTVDSEPALYMLHMRKDPEVAVKEIMETFEGAYSDVALLDGKLYVFRDPFALRPLVWGENDEFICFASESVALDVNGIPYKGNVRGGEFVVVEKGNIVERKQLVEEKTKHCMFEYVYFSRPDSVINNKSVYEVRWRLGEVLAEEAPVKADVVVPVPDTSRTAAGAYSEKTGIPYAEGLIKNRYIGRTFIMPDQEKRINAVKLKLNAQRTVLEGKSVVLLDDSIVRGTTLKEIVGMVRKAGAKEVHLRITCPPVKAPCFYGVDMSTYKELIANKKSVEEIQEHLGADSLAYISVEGLKKAVGLPVCMACLNEEYHTEFVRGLAEKEKSK
jgi:amidophosphoribosyltransferase